MRREETVDHNIKVAWHAIARMYNQQAIRHDMTMSMGFVLLNINSQEGTPATKIAPMMGLEARSLTRLLKTMEEKGWIRRASDKNDKRLARVFLTSEGKRRKEKAKETVIRFNNMVREHISQKKLNEVFEILQDITKLVESMPLYQIT